MYVKIDEIDSFTDTDSECFEENGFNMEKFKSGPPYVGKLLKPSNGKKPVEPKNEKFMTKTYTFDVTKCDETIDLIVSETLIVIPKGLKTPLLEQRKNKFFCKFHNFVGHKTSQCVHLVQNTMKDGRLKFAEKQKA